MRRGSLVGPLLIVLIGVLFLVNTMRPDLPLIEIAAKYWPFLLIGWGALRLMEILFWAARSRPLPRAGISGGEWTLIVFICLIGSGLYAANRFRPWQHLGVIAAKRVEVFGRAYDYPVTEQRQTAGKTPRILIENLQGSVRVVGADSPEIVVTGRKTVRALQESDADKANRQSAVELSAQGGQVVVRSNQDRVTGEPSVSTDLEITAPRGASIEGRGRTGDFEISDIDGAIDLSSDNAGVRIQNVVGNVRVDLRKSDLVRVINAKGAVELNGGRGRDIELENIGGEVTVNGYYSGDLQFRNLAKTLRFQDPRTTELRVEKVPGQIHLDLSEFSGSKLVGPVRFVARSRDVQLESFTQALEISVDRGDVSLRPLSVPLPKIDVRTRSGQVELALPETSKFQLKATTSRGEVNNDFGPVLRAESEPHRRGGTIEGSVGQGPSLVLATGRGSITVRKDSGETLEPRRIRGGESATAAVEIAAPEVQKH